MADISFNDVEHVKSEIMAGHVKGCSPFGRAEAWALYYAAAEKPFQTKNELKKYLIKRGMSVAEIRPTMATMANTVSIVADYVDFLPADLSMQDMTEKVRAFCKKLIEHSFQSVEALGAYGANLIQNGQVVMTHSFSSSMMSMLSAALLQGKKFTVICTESRPLRESLLGMRQLLPLGAEIIYVSDATMFEALKMADLALTGSDTLLFDGRAVNKMGTSLLSELCRMTSKPFYIASEVFKLDIRTREGYQVILQRRAKEELLQPEDLLNNQHVTVINQFFDITPAANITGVITEYGILPSQSLCGYWDKLKKDLMTE